MQRGLRLCRKCRYQSSVTAGTIFQDSRLPLRLWFRAIWHVTSQKNGVSALGLQRVLGLGSYQTAWAWLHKLRRAMVRPGRDRLEGEVEVDETYWGAEEEGVVGRQTQDKAIIAVAAQVDGRGIGRIRMARVADLKRSSLQRFIQTSVAPGSVIVTDGLRAYRQLGNYIHRPVVVRKQEADASEILPRVHLVISLLKRWLMGTHQGAVQPKHLDYYLDEFTFRFNRRKSASRGKLFYRLMQQAVQVPAQPYKALIHHNP
jgi:transposase-like protein